MKKCECEKKKPGKKPVKNNTTSPNGGKYTIIEKFCRTCGGRVSVRVVEGHSG